MRRKRRHERRPHHDRWLVSYADFITLLFAFFVVMYSAAQLDKRRAGQLATAIQTAFLQHGSLPDKPADVGGLADNGVPSNLPLGNSDLSTARATATVRLLIQSYGLRPELLGASGYAEYRPVASNESPAGRAANRRVDVVIPGKHG